MLGEGQAKGGGFARAGLGEPHQVMPLQQEGDGLALNRGRFVKPKCVDGLQDGGRQAQAFKLCQDKYLSGNWRAERTSARLRK